MALLPPLVQLEADLLRTRPEDTASSPFGLVVKLGDATLAVGLLALAVVLAPFGGWARAGRLLLLLPSAVCTPVG